MCFGRRAPTLFCLLSFGVTITVRIVAQINIKRLSNEYRAARRAVFERATLPQDASIKEHAANKKKLRTSIERICADADLNLYTGYGKEAAMRIWRKLWRINRYARIKSTIAAKEISDIASVFDDYHEFCNSTWNIPANRHQLVHGGKNVHHFLNRTGRFSGCKTVRNLVRLRKIVDIARKLKKFANQKKPKTPFLWFITNGLCTDDVWSIHKYLLEIGYTGSHTALHFMMDLGFAVIKPDIIISRQFLERGWLQIADSSLPKDLTLNDLEGKGAYRSRYDYKNPVVYMPIIDLARRIVDVTKPQDLVNDIGWATGNPLREFDIFLVKYGQHPDPDFGITQCLAKREGATRGRMKLRSGE